jgi:hypothetical protein
MLRAGLSVLLDWRKLLVGLRDAGLGIFKERPNLLQKMRNCPPSMFVTETLDVCTYPCDHLGLCPWCYGRWTREVFKMIERSMVHSDRLVWVVGRYYEPLDATVRQRLKSHRAQAARLNQANRNCKGSLLSVTAEPYTRKDKKCLRISHRHVALLRMGECFAMVPETYYGRTLDKLNRKRLVGPLAKVLRYPEYLFRGEPEDVVSIINGRSGLRLFESYGCFRAQPAKDATTAEPADPDHPGALDCP